MTPAAAATAKKQAPIVESAQTQGNMLEDFLKTVTEGYQAAHQKAVAAVEAAKAALAQAEANLAKVESFDPTRKTVTAPPQAAPRARAATGARRAPRGAMQAKILELLDDEPDGLGRAAWIEKARIKGNKAAESSLSNALFAMKKNSPVGYDGGIYLKPKSYTSKRAAVMRRGRV